MDLAASDLRSMVSLTEWVAHSINSWHRIKTFFALLKLYLFLVVKMKAYFNKNLNLLLI